MTSKGSLLLFDVPIKVEGKKSKLIFFLGFGNEAKKRLKASG
jgi:hypothetical protein